MKRSILILGATSAIARATANTFAEKGFPLYLAGRDLEELNKIAQDITIRYGVKVYKGTFDAENTESHALFLENVVKETGGLSGALLAFGDTGTQSASIQDFNKSQLIIFRNYIGACSILHYLANYFESQKSGFIIGISSVAGDRGRESNYVYGSAKAGLTAYLQGLRGRLHHSCVHVLTVKPGFVDTAMTFGLPGMFYLADPKEVGEKIVRGLEKKKEVMYIPCFWRVIMAIIKSIPEKLFKKLKL